MEESCRPTFQQELEELSLSKSYCKFTAESENERKFKTSLKLTEFGAFLFSEHGVQQHRVDKFTCKIIRLPPNASAAALPILPTM